MLFVPFVVHRWLFVLAAVLATIRTTTNEQRNNSSNAALEIGRPYHDGGVGKCSPAGTYA
jgi:hypothetical protein